MSRPRSSIAATCLAVLLFSTTAHAQVASYVRTILPAWGSEKVEKTPDNHFLVTRSDGVTEYDASWNVVRRIAIYGVIEGALKLPTGNLVVRDRGQSIGPATVPQFLLYGSGPNTISTAPLISSFRSSSPEMADNGDFFLALNPTSIGATITRYAPSLAPSTSWEVSTRAYAIAVKNGVVYLAGDADGKVWKFGLDGSPLPTVQTILGTPAWAIDVDDEGRMYVLTAPSANSLGGFLSILAPNGTRLQTIDRPRPGDAPYAYPRDVLVRGQTLYVSDQDKVHEYALQAAVPTRPATWGRVKALYR